MKKISRLFSKNKTKDDKQEKELAKLIQVMNEIMTLEMLQILYSELGITYEAFPGNSKTQKTKEVVIYFSRPPQVMDDLYEYLYKIRPDIPWKNILTYKRKPLSLPETARLAQIISYCFNDNELRNLCVDFGTNYEDLSGGSKQAKARELVLYFSRLPNGEEKVESLIQRCIELRPIAPWRNPAIKTYQPYQPKQLSSLIELLGEQFDDDELKEICDGFGINYRHLPGINEGGLPRELVLYLARREQISGLLDLCKSKRSEIGWFDTDQEINQPTPSKKLDPSDSDSLREILASSYTENQLRNLCSILGVDYDDLPKTREGTELYGLMLRRGRLADLWEAMNQIF